MNVPTHPATNTPANGSATVMEPRNSRGAAMLIGRQYAPTARLPVPAQAVASPGCQAVRAVEAGTIRAEPAQILPVCRFHEQETHASLAATSAPPGCKACR